MRAPILLAIIATATLASACRTERRAEGGAQGSATELPDGVRAAPAPPARYALGHVPPDSMLKAWDIDANPAGEGLPAGRGTAAQGATIFAAKCAACHGAKGEGLATFPKLIGREPGDSFPFANDYKYVKTIGNYWPYATTVYDYVNRAMPLTAPGSLRADEVYALTAFLLAENAIIPRDAVMDARSLPQVKMPAHDHFVTDDRRGGAGFR